MTDNSILYHYTTQEGFLGIVTDGVIRASSIQHLNDESEFQYAARMAFQLVDELTTDADIRDRMKAILVSTRYQWDAFVSSFSEQGDQLGQWRAYGQGGGISIGFDVESLKERAAAQSYSLEKCSYDAAANRAAIRPLLEWAVQKKPFEPADTFVFLNKFLRIAPKFKHPSFVAEEEWRLFNVRAAPFAHGKPYADIFYRPGKSFFVPYRNFALTDSHIPESLLPISKVYIGPTPHADLSVWTVRNCLHTKGLRMLGTKIEKSSIPYRNW
jgi:DUF2971 family protein